MFPEHHKRRIGVWGLLAALGLALTAGEAQAETVRLTVLATTDIHGHVRPYNYLRGKEAAWGLARVATFVRQVRARNPHTLLVDCGDTFQGTPLAYLHAVRYTDAPNPVVAAMNALGYDAMAVGNHEFNFGLRALWRLKAQARFPILGANVVSTYHNSLRDFPPYVVREVGGVRVGILGLVTPAVPRWDPPEHYAGYEFRGLVSTARQYVAELRQKADVVLLIVHSGLGREPETGEPLEPLYPEENGVWDVAKQVDGIDAIFFGHSHRELAGKTVNGALLIQPNYWAQSVGQLDLVMERKDGVWRVAGKTSRLVPMDDSMPPDQKLLELTHRAHQRSESWLNTVVARLEEGLDGWSGRVEDHPLVDLIHRAQLRVTGAEVSLASLFSLRTHWSRGAVTIRDVYSLYFYENQLFTVQITGGALKEALEYSARRFKSYPWEGSPFAAVAGYNYDTAEGVSYRIDLSRPPGQRIVDLRFQGEPLTSNRTLRLAINSYRWSGGGGFDMLRYAKMLDRTTKGVRQLIIEYLQEEKEVPTDATHNWSILPEEAYRALLDFVRPAEPVGLFNE